MNTKIQNPNPAELSPARFEEAMSRYAAAGLRGLELTKAIEAEVNEVLGRYEAELQVTAQVKNSAFEIMRDYCNSNKKKLFGKRRSIGTPYGIAGYRLGTPRLKISRGTTWGMIIEVIKEKLPGYIRTVEEPAKDLLLADRHKENVAPVLMELGVQVVQDELFYIETKKAA